MKKLPIVVIALLLAAVALWLASSGKTVVREATFPYRAEYVGRQKCVECHAQQEKDWLGSHHERAMLEPTAENVRGDFNDMEATFYGVTSKMIRKGNDYLVTTENQQGEMETFKVKYTFGWEPLQQYLVEFPDGRLQVLPLCWDTEKKEWFHIYAHEKIAPDDPLHWTRSMQNWDHMCAECHSTNVEKRFDLKTRRFSTTFSEINVSCEACHGPGGRHVELANQKSPNWETPEGYAMAELKREPRRQIETCAKCHSRKTITFPGHQPGASFYNHHLVELLEPWAPEAGQPVYHVDGQIDDEVYVYGSFIQSKMYHNGVRCTDCHNAHTARLHAEGNVLCTRCHAPKPENLKVYDAPEHHHHPPGKGRLCVECHMPEKTYMVVDPRRDHSLRVPRPDLSVKLGTPNACNRCHTDESSRWAADWVEKWFGPERPKDHFFAETIAAARNNKPDTEEDLIGIVRDKDASTFVRASSLLLLRRYPGAEGRKLARESLADLEPMVRIAALAKLSEGRLSSEKKYMLPLLRDPIASVRTEAARILTSISRGLTEESRNDFQRAWEELQARFQAHLDRPETHLAMAIEYEGLEQMDKAVEAYKLSLDIDELFVPSRFNLATLYSRQAKSKEAEKLLREVVRLRPDIGHGFYSLGLLVAENPQRLEEATEHLTKAADLMPRHPRAHYNCGLALWRQGNTEKAAEYLLTAHELAPQHPDYPFSLAQLLAQQRKWKEALNYARISAELAPGEPQRVQLYRQIEMSYRQQR
ncbi:MAG: tetratricopeptide repeat protein [Planctomycetota bacterium]|nr:tetratricopeptide repeat protein [Planctomycetota bacterium]MDP7129041.1 tetratricopeptide repeat protein [Planctomycetota bacterium]MDP7250278.1 tetratricopeptide repeat protein [Planctomycetota bacterium]